MEFTVRLANLGDIPEITEIYNQGIDDRIATLETVPKSYTDMENWFLGRDEKHKVLVLEDKIGKILGWTSLNQFNSRCCYSGVADLSIYIERSMRGKGLGKILLGSLIDTARSVGFHKLVLSALSSNTSGQRLYAALGFREVGTYKNHGILDGKWIDVTIMELLL